MPHEGFSILHRWAQAKRHGAFVFTSNVDGQFERAGFSEERVHACHGSLLYAQCTASCGAGIFAADFEVQVDPERFRALPPLPACPACGALARPNVLMFDDWEWDSERAEASGARLEAWLQRVGAAKVAVIELGAGTRVPTVRAFGERVARLLPVARLIRINLREPQIPPPGLALATTALEALRAIDARISSSR